MAQHRYKVNLGMLLAMFCDLIWEYCGSYRTLRSRIISTGREVAVPDEDDGRLFDENRLSLELRI
jgi:hypothetical protein